MRDWFVKLTKKKSGQEAKKLTDREQFVVDRLAFYKPQGRASVSQPMLPLQRTSAARASSEESGDEVAADQEEGEADLGHLEETAAREASRPKPKKRRRVSPGKDNGKHRAEHCHPCQNRG